MTINMIPHKCVVSAGILNTLYVKKTKPLLFISYEGHFLLCIMNTFTRGNTELGLWCYLVISMKKRNTYFIVYHFKHTDLNLKFEFILSFPTTPRPILFTTLCHKMAI